MKNIAELKQRLTQVKDNDYNIPDGIDTDALIVDMLTNIGHPDGELRDGLIYSTFGSWVENGSLTIKQMKHILTTCLGENYLFHGIGEKDTDTVFTRSFSSLAIALAFVMHDEKPFLTQAEVGGIKDAVLHYISQEKDYRGYVPGKGWAHAIAHAADALANIAGVDKAADIDGDYSIGREGLLEILDAIKMLAINPALVYDAEEDERLAEAAMYVIYTEVLSNDDICSWIADFAKYIDRNTMPSDYFRKINQKHFLRSLYFELIADDDLKELSKYLFDIKTTRRPSYEKNN